MVRKADLAGYLTELLDIDPSGSLIALGKIQGMRMQIQGGKGPEVA